MRMRSLISGSVLSAAALPSRVAAHSGHGQGDGSGAVHFLTEPTHWVPFVVAVALAVGGIVLLRGRRTRRAVVIDDDRGKYL